MANFNIEYLTALLNKPDASKEEIIAKIDQIQFASVPFSTKSEGSKDILKDHLDMRDAIKSNSYMANKYSNIGRNQQRMIEHSNTQQSSASKGTEEDLKLNTLIRSDQSLKNNLLQGQGKCESINNKPQSPNISKLNQNSQRVPDFLGRMQSYQHKTKIGLETQQRETELNQYNFSPKTSAESPHKPSFYGDLKCYEVWKKKSMEQRLLKKDEKEKKKLKECTFYPMTNSKKIREYYATNSLKKLHAWDKGCNDEFTFHPEVKLLPKPRKKLQEYLNTNPYERLSKLVGIKKESRIAQFSLRKVNKKNKRAVKYKELGKGKKKLDLTSSLPIKNSHSSETLKKLMRKVESVLGRGSSNKPKIRMNNTITSSFINQKEGARNIICYLRPQEKLITEELENHLRSVGKNKKNQETKSKLGKKNKLKCGVNE